MKFFNEKEHFSKKKYFKTRKNAQSSNILIFAAFVTEQSINWSSIEILIKIENPLKLNSLDIFFWKSVFFWVNEFHELHDDLKVYKKVNILYRKYVHLKNGVNMHILCRSESYDSFYESLLMDRTVSCDM